MTWQRTAERYIDLFADAVDGQADMPSEDTSLQLTAA
jgi:hypothetical protein